MYKYFAAYLAASALAPALDGQHADASIEQLYIFPLDAAGSSFVLIYRQKQAV